MAPACDAYARGLENIIPHFAEQISTLTDAYDGYVKSINLETKAGRGELEAMRGKLRGMIASFKSTADKAKNLREDFRQVAQSNHSPRLTRSAGSLVDVIDRYSSVYEELETFGLKTLFATDEKKSE